MYKASKSATPDEFEQYISEIRSKNIKVFQYLVSIPKENWVLAFSIYPNYYFVSSSPVESYNHVIMKERKTALANIIIGIRLKCSKRNCKYKLAVMEYIEEEPDIVKLDYIVNIRQNELKSIYTPYYRSVFET